MSASTQRAATEFYRLAARVSARMLALSPIVESLALHRSVATGEVHFGRSDIDMLMVVNEEKAEDGANMASLYQTVRRARWFNPALSHFELYDAGGLLRHARRDTFWASVERRMMRPLCGRPVEIPVLPVDPEHSLNRFLLWVEWFFSIAVQQKNQRNLRKTSLEAWNAFASTEGLIAEPYLTRGEMEAAARQVEGDAAVKRLNEPSGAVRFVFDMVDRLHRSRLPALRKLAKPLVFEAILAPLCFPRRFVVLPRADSSLPPETFVPGAFPCTPEYLDLFLHTKNAFLSWILPPELVELGVGPPTPKGFLKSCGFYGDRRFLTTAGFADPSPPIQRVRITLIRNAMECALRGEMPPPIPQEEIRQKMKAAPTIPEYYATQYSPLWRECRQIQELAGG